MAETSTATDESAQPEFIANAETDIAMTYYGERMAVNYPGRQKYQKIWVHTGKTGGATKIMYDEAEDAPVDWKPSIAPTQREIQADPQNMIEMLVVGLIIVDKPTQYSNKGTKSKSKANDIARSQRGILERPERTTRALIQVSDYVKPVALWFITLPPVHELCNIRKISADAIFYYSEFIPPNFEKIGAHLKPQAIANLCKYAAAKVKEEPVRDTVLVGQAADPKWRSAKLKVTTNQQKTNQLFMYTSLWNSHRDPATLDHMKAALHEWIPELENKAKSGSAGVDAFFDSTIQFDTEISQKMLDELNSFYDDLPVFDAKLIVRVRDILCKATLMDRVPRHSLTLFLMMVANSVAVLDDEEKATLHIRLAVDHINAVKQWQTLRSANALQPLDKDGEMILVDGVTDMLQGAVDFLRDYATEMARHHGGIQAVNTMEELMTRLGNTVDRTSFKLRCEEVFAIHAEQLARANSKGADMIQDIINLLKTANGQGSV